MNIEHEKKTIEIQYNLNIEFIFGFCMIMIEFMHLKKWHEQNAFILREKTNGFASIRRFERISSQLN